MSPNSPINALLIFLSCLAFLLGIFLIIRSVMLWYWKINVIVKNQEEQTMLLMQQNELLKTQNDLIAEFKEQSGRVRVAAEKGL
jgi:Tfp pilus assembly protein PilN